MSFWKSLEQPFFVLAPMEDVTDTVFREVILSVSEASPLKVLFTEFTSVDGLLDQRGHEKVVHRLLVNASEQLLLTKNNVKLVAQIWGNNPEQFFKAAKFIQSLQIFDGIDINMGCPVKKVVAKNSCSALIKEPGLARDIIQATTEAVNVPVSVKTRIGFNQVQTEEWIGHLLTCKLSAITIHGRTQKQLSDGLANWNEIAKAVQLKSTLSPKTAIIGNGDVESVEQGRWLALETGVDGIMVGRGIFKNPWMFQNLPMEISVEQRLGLLRKHIELYYQYWGTDKNFQILKRFFKIYLNGFSGAALLRAQLMETRSCSDALQILETFPELV